MSNTIILTQTLLTLTVIVLCLVLRWLFLFVDNCVEFFNLMENKKSV